MAGSIDTGLAGRRRDYLRRLSGFAPSETGGPDIVRLDYPAADLFLYVSSRAEKKLRAFSCAKEPWTIEWLERSLAPGRVLYDIGANVGAYALVAARRVAPGGRVFAFEPGYATFAHLCDNIVLNGCAELITPLSIPLTERTGLGMFSYDKLYPGHARHQGLEAGSLAGPGVPAYEQPVAAMRLDDLVTTFGLPTPDCVKLDVDGAELSVLAGAGATLRAERLRSVLVEVDDQHAVAVTATLREAGLHLASRHERDASGERLPFWYGIFERAA